MQLLRSHRFASIIIVALSIALGFAAFRIMLQQSSRQTVRAFEAENQAELARSDVFALSSRLNSLSAAVHWTCIRASRGNAVFFERTRGACGPRPWNAVVEAVSSSASEIRVHLTLRLGPSLEAVSAGVLMLQLALLFSLASSARAAERDRLQSEIALAETATQVAHDLRAPLGVLRAVLPRPDAAPDPEAARLAREAVDRLAAITHSLLDRFRSTVLPSHPLGPTLAPEVLAELTARVVSQSRAALGATIEFAPSHDALSRRARVGADDFMRVVSNLITNAVDASSAERHSPVRVTLDFKGQGLELAVIDRGVGMAPAILKLAGQRAFTHGKRGGTGLGLYHARMAVKRWKGRLRIESQTGQGTRVSLWLPESS